MMAEKVPVVAGVNMTLIWQLVPAARLRPQFELTGKSVGSLLDIPPMASAAVPELVRGFGKGGCFDFDFAFESRFHAFWVPHLPRFWEGWVF
jgi:hypothetical protein